jgi:hypothetical protein
MELTRKHVITGIILPQSWDKSGKVVEVALYTDKEDVYPVEDNRLTRALMDLTQKQVEVKCKIQKRDDGSPSIIVQNYRLLE